MAEVDMQSRAAKALASLKAQGCGEWQPCLIGEVHGFATPCGLAITAMTLLSLTPRMARAICRAHVAHHVQHHQPHGATWGMKFSAVGSAIEGRCP